MAEHPESFDSFVRALQRETTKLKEASERVGLPLEYTDAVLSWEADPASKVHDRKLAFRHRCEDLGDLGDRFYVQWLEESMLSHASFTTASMYLGDSPEGSDAPTLNREPQFPSQDLAAEAACADLMVLALDAFSRMAQGDPLRPVVDQLNAEKDVLIQGAANL